jgi:hypothetical protein
VIGDAAALFVMAGLVPAISLKIGTALALRIEIAGT